MNVPNNIKPEQRTNQAGVDLIKRWEGLELKAYPDPATGGDPWTIGYGHTGPDVKPGRTITETEAEALLKQDLQRFEKGVLGLIKCPITDNQFAALVSFAYNCGLGNLSKSTLLRKVNAKDFQSAANEFERWNRANGKVYLGLTRRREAEKLLFLKE